MKEAENVQNFKLRHFSIFVCYSKYYIEVDFVKIPPIGSFKRYRGQAQKSDQNLSNFKNITTKKWWHRQQRRAAATKP